MPSQNEQNHTEGLVYVFPNDHGELQSHVVSLAQGKNYQDHTREKRAETRGSWCDLLVERLYNLRPGSQPYVLWGLTALSVSNLEQLGNIEITHGLLLILHKMELFNYGFSQFGEFQGRPGGAPLISTYTDVGKGFKQAPSQEEKT